MDTKEVANILEEMGSLLALRGENPFKSRAYFNAAKTIATYRGEFTALVKEGRLRELKGIGEALAEKITTLVMTGRLPYYEELKASVPPSLLEMLRIPGLGPKKAKVLYDHLHIRSLKELEKACRHHKVAALEGFGPKMEANILRGLMHLHKHHGQFLLHQAQPVAETLVCYLRDHPAAIRVEVAGSLRRNKEVVKDLDLVASVQDAQAVGDHFVRFKDVERVVARGETKISVELKQGIPVDLRMVSDQAFPYALHHFTGSHEHNTAMRRRAQEKFHIKMNEYGLFHIQGEQETLMPCQTERHIFEALGLDEIPPELREDRGEIEAAERHALPILIEFQDLKGVVHCHSNWSDGRASILEMAQAAQKMGFQYLGIADHSQSAAYAGGLTPERVERQREEIEKVNKTLKGLTVWQGLEVDILKDGNLDMPDHTLASLDYVVISVHSRFQMTRDEMTKRIIKAMTHPCASILSHPTGRLLTTREPYEMDMEAVLEVAAKTHTIVEINANPRRLDLDWRWCPLAKKLGVSFGIHPDAHDPEGLQDLRFGVGIARKGWLTKADVVNTLPRESAWKRYRLKRA